MLTSHNPEEIAAFNETGSIPWPLFVKFLAQFSHDVRNGLNAVELQLTLAGELSRDEEVSHEIRRARQSIADLAKKVQAARDATSPVSLNRMPYKISDFFEDLPGMLARLSPAEAKRLQIASLNGEQGEFVVDPEALPAAIARLLDNSSYFGAKEEPLVLDVSVSDDEVLIQLKEKRDADPEVDPAQWGTIPLKSTRRAGYGLGLFQARQIVAGHGGSIGFDYSPESKTLTTNVRIPRKESSSAS